MDGQTVPDIIDDDTALAYVTDAGVYIITGCSHAGICNIIQYAKAVTGKTKEMCIRDRDVCAETMIAVVPHTLASSSTAMEYVR